MKKSYLLLMLSAWISTAVFAQWNKVDVAGTSGVTLLFKDGTTIWGGVQGTTFKSADKGATWTKVSTGLNSSLAKNTGFAKVGDAVYTTFGGNGNYYAYYTTNGTEWTIDTANWPKMSMPFIGTVGLYSLQTLSHKNEYVMCRLESNYIIYKRKDDVQWTHMTLPNSHRTPNWVYSSGDTVFLYNNNNSFDSSNVAYTTDLGASWNIRTANASIFKISTTDVQGKLIGVGTTSLPTMNKKQLFVSSNNGASWDSLNLRAFSAGEISDIAAMGNTIYASLVGSNSDTLRKVVRSTDGGANWEDLTEDLYSHIQFKFHPITDIELIDGSLFLCISNILFKYGGSTGLSENTVKNTINVYPNPVSDNLYINIKNDAIVRFFDVTGKLYLSTETVNGKVDVSALNSGIYMMQVISDNETSFARIIKE